MKKIIGIGDFFNPLQKPFMSAEIRIGVYMCKGFKCRQYKTKRGIMRALLAYGYPFIHPYSGEEWIKNGVNYSIHFDYI